LDITIQLPEKRIVSTIWLTNLVHLIIVADMQLWRPFIQDLYSYASSGHIAKTVANFGQWDWLHRKTNSTKQD